ncbi:MAG: hypothetical protein JSV63_00800 [Candidatus Aenigmatarchaeota archaeon]|nr:MAG: hypothetical protein JSV63_00800 [Candidatus Aenigmarchaeota archaeon]
MSRGSKRKDIILYSVLSIVVILAFFSIGFFVLRPIILSFQPPFEPLDIPKSDRPEVHAFIMSYCPYGLQFLKAYIPVIELLGDKADIEVNFVPYIMHGENELIDNNNFYCVQKEQKDKFTNYLRCFIENNGSHEQCVGDVGIDGASHSTCLQQVEEDFKVTESFKSSNKTVTPYPIDAELAQVYNVRGSPSFGINGQSVTVRRSAEAIKQAICAAFNSPPKECSETLNLNIELPGFGPLGAGTQNSLSGGVCG